MPRQTINSRRLTLLLQLLLAASVIWLQSQTAALTPELNLNGLTETVVEQISENELPGSKRAWQSLQSSWGKRGDNNEDVEDAIYVTGHFVPLLITDGENTVEWSTFQQLANGQQHTVTPLELESMEQPEVNISNEKRTWKNMNVAWGKRRQAQNWNKFRGAWGKREPAWNNLKGMWGKRDQWQKLHGGWGKRSALN